MVRKLSPPRTKAANAKGAGMGHVYVDVTLRPIGDPGRSVVLHCLADTGATDTVVPADLLQAKGVQPDHQREYELADGRKVSLNVGFAVLEFEGERTTADVVFGEPGTEPILGVTAMESTGFTVDPRRGILQKQRIRL